MPEVDRLKAQNEQLRRELGVNREKVTVTASSLRDYALNEPDPLVSGVPKRDNPFIKKSSCTIL